MYMIIGACLIR